MSKYLKQLITDHFRDRLAGLDEALLVNLDGVDAVSNNRLRRELLAKNIHVMVIKNSLVRRAAEGSPLAEMFDSLEGPAAVAWGGEDIISLAKEVQRLAGQKEYEPFAAKGGIMDGNLLTADGVKEISKLPSRDELLSMISGQIIGLASQLSGQISSLAGQLASQIDQLAEKEEDAGDA